MGSVYICPPLSPYIIPMLYTTFSLFFLSFSLLVLYFTTLLLDKLFKDMRERKSNARKVGGTRRKSKKKELKSSIGPYVVAAGSFTPPS
jgi:hypothetical protein